MNRLALFFKKTWPNFSLLERIFCFLFLFSLIVGLIFLFNFFLNKITVEVPKNGGSLKLGLICHPSLINPIFLSINDCDRDLTEVIFDGLFEIDGKGGIVPRLAEKVEISPDGKTYTVILKNNIFWHDGMPITSEDVAFTVETIQNPKIKSPLRLNWEGIVVEPLSSSVVRFYLRNPYGSFLEHLTLKIIPKHIWQNIEPENFALAEYNLKPVGSGPYLFESLEKDKNGKILGYSLLANQDYYLTPPKINNLVFHFYNSSKEAKEALLKKEIEGFSPVSLEDIGFFKEKKGIELKNLVLTGYYAVFYNLKNPLFTLEIRKALELAIDKNQLVSEVFKNQVLPLDNIFLPPFSLKKINNSTSSLKEAEEILSKLGYSKDKPLKFKLYLPDDEIALNVSNFLINSWKKIGVEVEPVVLSPQQLTQEVIETRTYDALFFGEIIGEAADLYSFWHSSQINSPGLNLSLYKNKNLDALIEENRIILDSKKREENFEKISQIFKEEKPALFLYNSYYLYLLPQKVKGNNISLANLPSERFADISNWYLYTQKKLKLK